MTTAANDSATAGIGAGIEARTPPDRDRFIDFLRAASISVVILGHWLMAVVVPAADGVRIGNALSWVPAMRPATWLLQVMPLFFFVGGFANSRALASGKRTYGQFLAGRVRRLLAPTAVFVGAWLAIAALASLLHVQSLLVWTAARMVGQPLWFLGVYLLVIMGAPLALRAQRRAGLSAAAALGLAVAAIDVARLVFGLDGLGVVNYLLVWLFAHQLGVAYQAGRFAGWSRRRLALVTGAALAGLIVLTGPGPYPVSMVGVPGEATSNMSPPSVCVIVLTVWLVGLALLLREPLTRMLARPRAWAAVVGVHAWIMTAYLWHMTAMLLVLLVLHPGGDGVGGLPGTPMWWLTRPLWVAGCLLPLVALCALLGRFEQPRPSTRSAPAVPGTTRVVLGCVAFAIALLAFAGAGFSFERPGHWVLAGLELDPLRGVTAFAAGALLVRGARVRGAR